MAPSTERTSPEGLAHHIPGRLLTGSRRLSCPDVFVEMISRRSVQDGLIIPAVAEPLIVWILSGGAIVEEREIDGPWSRTSVRAGDFFLTSAPKPYELHWRSTGPDPFEVMHLYVGLAIIDRAAADVLGGQPRPVSFRDVSGGQDPMISLLLNQVRTELLRRDAPSVLLVGGLARAIAVHLVRTYRDEAPPKVMRGALPAARLRRVVDLMEAGRSDEFRLGRLAQEVGMSEFHFSRLFKRSTGLAPSQYFIRLRVTEARRLLRETELSVIEVGLKVGYSSPAHFAQVFRRETGVTPSEYRG